MTKTKQELRTTLCSRRLAGRKDGDVDDAPRFKESDYALIRHLVNELSDEQRLMVEMYFWQGLSATEIACTLGISWGQVREQLSEAYAKLRLLCEISPQFSRFCGSAVP